MSDAVHALLLVAAVTVGVNGGILLLRVEERRIRLRPAAVALWLCVAVPSLLQIPFPALLEALQRDPGRIETGQVWRVLTSVVVQDGGVPGTTFNLLALAAMALVAGSWWSGGRVWLLFLGCHLLTNGLVLLTFAPVGAGNSVATIALGTAMVATLAQRHPRIPHLALTALTLALGVTLLLGHDIHGIAVCVGLVVGVASSCAWSSGRSFADAA